MGLKPPHHSHGASASNNSAPVPSKGNHAAAATAAAASAAKSGQKPPPFWAAWGEGLNKQSLKMRANADNFAAQFRGKNGQFKVPKFEMPVHVDVDFLNPTMTTIKQTARNMWMQLPPQVQQAAPYVAVGLTSSLVVYKVKQHQLYLEQKKTSRLTDELEKTVVERNELRSEVSNLKAIAQSQANQPRSASEMRMAAAVAQSTSAAAAAATAAADAAAKCLFQPMQRRASRPGMAH